MPKGSRKKKSWRNVLIYLVMKVQGRGDTVLYVQYVQLGCQPKNVGREKRFARHKIDTKRTQHFKSTFFSFQPLPCLLRITSYHSATGEWVQEPLLSCDCEQLGAAKKALKKACDIFFIRNSRLLAVGATYFCTKGKYQFPGASINWKNC
jgi:hypothetical protein